MVYSVLESPNGWSSAFKMYWKWPILCNFYLHRSYTKSFKLLNFGKLFQRWLFSKLKNLNYQTLIKTYLNKPYKKPEFLAGLKKLSRETEKKIKFLCIYVMQTKDQNLHTLKMVVWAKNSTCDWNKTWIKNGKVSISLGQRFVVAIKKMLFKQFSYIEIVRYAFFSKKKKHSFFHRQTVSLGSNRMEKCDKHFRCMEL